MVLQDYVHAVTDAEERVERLTKQIADLAQNWSQAPVVAALQAMRGVAFIVAVTLVAEVGDFTRFANPRQLMAYLGLVPSEHSSGSSVRRAGITKAGNALARRALIEGAWTYRMQPRVSRKLHDRIDGLPQRESQRSFAPPPSPAKCSGLFGRSPKPSRPLAPFNTCSTNAHGRRRGAVRESSCAVMSRLGRRSPLDRGSPRRNHGHAVTNPRMRACSTVVSGPVSCRGHSGNQRLGPAR